MNIKTYLCCHHLGYCYSNAGGPIYHSIWILFEQPFKKTRCWDSTKTDWFIEILMFHGWNEIYKSVTGQDSVDPGVFPRRLRSNRNPHRNPSHELWGPTDPQIHEVLDIEISIDQTVGEKSIKRNQVTRYSIGIQVPWNSWNPQNVEGLLSQTTAALARFVLFDYIYYNLLWRHHKSSHGLTSMSACYNNSTHCRKL